MSVLISSAGRRVGLVNIFREALREAGVGGRVVAVDASPMSAAYVAADSRHLVPSCLDPKFVPAVLEVCREERVCLIVPTIDTELPVYAAAREEFAEEGVLVAVSSPETIAISADKQTTHAFLREHGLPTVDQATVAEVQADPTAWPYPLVVKPVAGSASTGVQVVEDDVAFAAAVAQGDVTVQRLALGQEYTIDCLIGPAGNLLESVPRARLEVRAGEVSKAVTVRMPVLTALAERVCAALPGAFGVLNLQLFHDEATDDSRIIEINPRFGGGFPLAHRAGVGFAQWLVETAWDLEPTADLRWTDGLVMLRYDEAVFFERGDDG